MQCPNCGLENIPGLARCARCQSVLGVGDVSVVPPRASALRITTRLLRAWYATRLDLSGFWDWLRRPRTLAVLGAPAGSLGLTLLLPGLAHIRARHRTFGQAVFAAWLGALLAALAVLASPWSMRCLLVAIFVHTLAFVSLLTGSNEFSPARRFLLGLAVFFGLQWAWYRPWALLAGCVIVPVTISNVLNNDVIRNGDGVLHEGGWLRPRSFRRGELVAYDIPRAQLGQVYLRSGLGVDRVVGLPGERVCWHGGRLLTIDGQERDPEAIALGSLRHLPQFDIRLKDDEYLIPPTRLNLRVHGAPADLQPLLAQLLVVPGERIRGRVFWRTWPWWRWGRIE